MNTKISKENVSGITVIATVNYQVTQADYALEKIARTFNTKSTFEDVLDWLANKPIVGDVIITIPETK